MSDHTRALLRALEGCFPGLRFTARSIRSRDWASATFAAVRHRIGFSLAGEGAAAAADAFARGLEERDFPMRGHVVVEIGLVSRADLPGRVDAVVEALTIADA